MLGSTIGMFVFYIQDPGLNLDYLITSNAVINNAEVLGSAACAEHVVQIQNNNMFWNK